MTKRLTIALIALAMFVLVAVMPVSATYQNTGTVSGYTQTALNINAGGASVYIGEQGLDLTTTLAAARAVAVPATTSTQIGWWASAAVITTTAPTISTDLQNLFTNYQISPSTFVGYTGNWYLLTTNGQAAVDVAGKPIVVFNVKDPSLAIKVWDYDNSADVTGASVTQGEKLGFGVETNMYSALDARYRGPVYNRAGLVNTPNLVGDGYMMIRVKDASGTTLTNLYSSKVNAQGLWYNPLTYRNVSVQPYTWGTEFGNNYNWDTGALETATQKIYPAGTYTVFAESFLNNMKNNYKSGGSTYTGKTISATVTITIVSDTVKITANKDTVVRSKPFSVTITGKPSTSYHVWLKGTNTMDGTKDNEAPMLQYFQDGVTTDTAYPAVAGDYPIGNYHRQNGAGQLGSNATGTIRMNVGTAPSDGIWYYALVKTSTGGTRTVEFITTRLTKAQKYTVRVERETTTVNFYGAASTGIYQSDEVDVKVEKGAVTIVAAGDQSYYLGEEIKFSGTNTETDTVFLFIMGPNLKQYGSQIESDNPRLFPAGGVTGTDPTKLQNVDVLADNTWSWKWGTSNVALDAGTYTIYATSQPSNSEATNLENCAYGTVSIIIKKPFISATASQSTVAQGDRIYVLGTAEGKPSVGVQIWVLGKNYAVVAQNSVSSDSSFSYEIKREVTKTLFPGQYFVVAQHPMQNDQFDVYLKGQDVYNRMLGTVAGGTKVFNLLGAGSLQGSDAAEALVQAINDPNVDDTYTKLQFLIEVPVITITPIGDRHVGDKFTILATTNLAVDDEILVEVYSSSFKPTQKSQSGEFSGATGTVKVTKGTGGLNQISFDVDASTFKPDEYIVTENAVLQTATGSALFNVLEGAAPTAVPTVVKTVATPVVTAPPTAPPTTVPPTPTKTPTQPGFGALVALIGLGAVAFLVVRRH